MDAGGEDVTPDGSPVPVYLALPAEPEFSPVLDFLEPGVSVLDLGCGVGRLANVLAERGCAVTGVDESRAMLQHLHPDVVAVEARLEDLRLGQTFDAVVLSSHLVNVTKVDLRQRFLATCASHTTPKGAVLVQHYDTRRPLNDSEGQVGDVAITFKVLGRHAAEFRGEVEYGLGDRSWTQQFTAALLDDDALDRELAAAGLRRTAHLSAAWVAATLADS